MRVIGSIAVYLLAVVTMQIIWNINFINVLYAQESTLPDHDGSGHHSNQPQTGLDFGLLSPEPATNEAIVSREGELGIIQPFAALDSVDYFRFQLPHGNWSVTVSLEEMPGPTMWLQVWRSLPPQGLVCRGYGHNGEVCGPLPMGEGRYFIEVRTDAESAAGRLLRYRLRVSVRPILQQDPGAISCADGPDIGILPTVREFSGSFGLTGATTSSYSSHFPLTGRISALRVANVPVEVYFIQRSTRTRYRIGDDSMRQIETILDPGFYCVQIVNKQPGTMLNYRVQIGNVSFRPTLPGDLGRAQQLTHMDVGSLRANGSYGSDKYVNYRPPSNSPSELAVGRTYVVREWVSLADRDHLYAFDLVTARSISVVADNFYVPINIDLLRMDGVVVRSAATVNGSSFDERLLPKTLASMVPVGHYFVRVSYADQSDLGTPYQLAITAVNP